MRWGWVVVVLLIVAAPVSARISFIPLPPQSPMASRIGSDGISSTAGGVEFWQNGTPSRPYQLLGFLMGTSERELLKSFGTPALAERVRAAGGDALILTPVSDLPLQVRAAIEGIPGAPEFQFWVVKYLAADADAVSEGDHARQVTELQAWTIQQCNEVNSLTSMAGLSPGQRRAIRKEIRETIARIAHAIRNEPAKVRRETEEMHRLTMQMLDCQEQREIGLATDAAIRGGVGTVAKWTSPSDPTIQGRSIAAAEETLSDGTHCVDVTDVIIIDGEEVLASKRMCRARGAAGYRMARIQQG